MECLWNPKRFFLTLFKKGLTKRREKNLSGKFMNQKPNMILEIIHPVVRKICSRLSMYEKINQDSKIPNKQQGILIVYPSHHPYYTFHPLRTSECMNMQITRKYIFIKKSVSSVNCSFTTLNRKTGLNF